MDSHAGSFASSTDSHAGRCPRRDGATRDGGAEEPDSSQLRNLRLDDHDHDHDHDEKIRGDGDEYGEDEDGDLRMFTDYGIWIDNGLRMSMEMEKKTYPGASTWALDEERLFEILYLRQELPILPSFWEIDFRGFPMSERCFSTADGAKPIIYAHSREFRATMALTRLIDLTANVRTVLQCGLPHKASPMIKHALDGYISWAAQDGSFAHLKIVPNIIAEIVDPAHGEAGVTRTIENRMRALARLQREYLRVRRHAAFEDAARPGGAAADGATSWRARGLRLMNVFFRLFETRGGPQVPEIKMEDAHHDDDGCDALHEKERQHGATDGEARHGPFSETIKEEERESEDAPMADIPLAPSQHHERASRADGGAEGGEEEEDEDFDCDYRRRPPVVYGLFIVNTSIFIMSVDSARGETGYVSFHVDVDLKEHKQSVWNALTMAMVVCLARDEMMSRLDDFEEVTAVEEIDVDV